MKKKALSPTELCKRHNVDHTGTTCGSCDLKNKKDSNKLRAIKTALKSYEKTESNWPEDDHVNLSGLYSEIKAILRRRK